MPARDPPQYTPVSKKPGDNATVVCLCGVGAGAQAAASAAARLEEGLRRHVLLHGEEEEEEEEKGATIVVEPHRTFIAFPSPAAAAAFHRRWDGQVLPHGLSAHRVRLQWGLPFKERRGPEPEDSVAATRGVRVPGLGLLREFVTAEEEAALLRLLDARPWDDASLKGRRTQHYGACAIDFRRRDIAETGAAAVPPIPPACAALLARARALLCMPSSSSSPSTEQEQGKEEEEEGGGNVGENGDLPSEPVRRRRSEGPLAAGDGDEEGDQMTANEYQPGEGIAAHVDVHSLFEDGFLIVSLGADCVMDFRLPSSSSSQSQHPESQRHKAVLLPRRSLLVLEGEARFRWSHGIGSRKTEKVGGVLVDRGRRVSLSFRRVRRARGCAACGFPEQCDWQQQGQGQGQGRADDDTTE